MKDKMSVRVYLTKEVRKRTNLTIKGNCFVERLLFDNNNSIQGVVIKSKMTQ